MIKKVREREAAEGAAGEARLAAGSTVALRLWEERPGEGEAERRSEHETVGYVLSGRAELSVEDHQTTLEPGDSWLVPKGARHRYRILEPFRALEATSPPAWRQGAQDRPTRGSSAR